MNTLNGKMATNNTIKKTFIANLLVSLLFASIMTVSPIASAQGDECGNYDADNVFKEMLDASRLQQKMLSKYQSHVSMSVTQNGKHLDTYEGEKTYSAESGLTYFPSPKCGKFVWGVYKQSISKAASEDEDLALKIKNEIYNGRANPVEFSNENYSEIIHKGCEVLDGVAAVKFSVKAKRDDKGLFDGFIWINPKTNRLIKSAGTLKGVPKAWVASASYEAQYATVDGSVSIPVKVTTKLGMKVIFGNIELTQTLNNPRVTTSKTVGIDNSSTTRAAAASLDQSAHR